MAPKPQYSEAEIARREQQAMTGIRPFVQQLRDSGINIGQIAKQTAERIARSSISGGLAAQASMSFVRRVLSEKPELADKLVSAHLRHQDPSCRKWVGEVIARKSGATKYQKACEAVVAYRQMRRKGYSESEQRVAQQHLKRESWAATQKLVMQERTEKSAIEREERPPDLTAAVRKRAQEFRTRLERIDEKMRPLEREVAEMARTTRTAEIFVGALQAPAGVASPLTSPVRTIRSGGMIIPENIVEGARKVLHSNSGIKKRAQDASRAYGSAAMEYGEAIRQYEQSAGDVNALEPALRRLKTAEERLTAAKRELEVAAAPVVELNQRFEKDFKTGVKFLYVASGVTGAVAGGAVSTAGFAAKKAVEEEFGAVAVGGVKAVGTLITRKGAVEAGKLGVAAVGKKIPKAVMEFFVFNSGKTTAVGVKIASGAPNVAAAVR